MRYALYFVPHKLEREKLALLRRQLCKRFKNRKAVMYPVHLTLVREFLIEDYKGFMKELEEFLSEQKPIKLNLEPNLTSKESWGGVQIKKSARLNSFQKELSRLTKKYGSVEKADFDPHISLVYAKNLPALGRKTSPVKKLVLDRISLVLQTQPETPFRIAKHLPLGTDGSSD